MSAAAPKGAPAESYRMRRKRADGPIKFRTNFRNVVYSVLKSRPGWVETDSETEWDFQWAERDWVYESFDTMHLEPWQRMNHFRNGRELCRKDLLAKNIKRTKRAVEKEVAAAAAASAAGAAGGGGGSSGGGGRDEAALAKYDFAPITFILPMDYALFVEEFKRPQHAGAVWIMKPIARSQGKGIFLFNKLQQITQWKSEYRWKPENAAVEAYVVQEYLSSPYLIGGKKFDLRVYALVTSYAPLTVWIYRTGFTRFSASRYSSDPADIANAFMHLTNVAVQKTSTEYNVDMGGKWEIGKLKQYIACKHGCSAADKLFYDIQEVMLHALFCVQKQMLNDPHCFELYGYDILIDSSLKPWLLEVNASPSMTASTRDDFDLKYKLLNDTLDIVDMEGRLTGDEETIGGFDLVWRGDAYVRTVTPPVHPPPGAAAAMAAVAAAAAAATAASSSAAGSAAVATAGAGVAADDDDAASSAGGAAAMPRPTATSAAAAPSSAGVAAPPRLANPVVYPTLSMSSCMMGAAFDPRVNVIKPPPAPAAPTAGAATPATAAAAAPAAAAPPSSKSGGGATAKAARDSGVDSPAFGGGRDVGPATAAGTTSTTSLPTAIARHASTAPGSGSASATASSKPTTRDRVAGGGPAAAGEAAPRTASHGRPARIAVPTGAPHEPPSSSSSRLAREVLLSAGTPTSGSMSPVPVVSVATLPSSAAGGLPSAATPGSGSSLASGHVGAAHAKRGTVSASASMVSSDDSAAAARGILAPTTMPAILQRPTTVSAVGRPGPGAHPRVAAVAASSNSSAGSGSGGSGKLFRTTSLPAHVLASGDDGATSTNAAPSAPLAPLSSSSTSTASSAAFVPPASLGTLPAALLPPVARSSPVGTLHVAMAGAAHGGSSGDHVASSGLGGTAHATAFGAGAPLILRPTAPPAATGTVVGAGSRNGARGSSSTGFGVVTAAGLAASAAGNQQTIGGMTAGGVVGLPAGPGRTPAAGLTGGALPVASHPLPAAATGSGSGLASSTPLHRLGGLSRTVSSTSSANTSSTDAGAEALVLSPVTVGLMPTNPATASARAAALSPPPSSLTASPAAATAAASARALSVDAPHTLVGPAVSALTPARIVAPRSAGPAGRPAMSALPSALANAVAVAAMSSPYQRASSFSVSGGTSARIGAGVTFSSPAPAATPHRPSAGSAGDVDTSPAYVSPLTGVVDASDSSDDVQQS